MNVVGAMESREQYEEYCATRDAVLNGCTVSVTIGTEAIENDEVILYPDDTVTGESKPTITIWSGYIYFTIPLTELLVSQLVSMHEEAKGEEKMISVSLVAYDELLGKTDTITCINPPAMYRKDAATLCVVNRFYQVLYDHTQLDAVEIENELDYEAAEAETLARMEAEKKARLQEEQEAAGWLTNTEDDLNPLT